MSPLDAAWLASAIALAAPLLVAGLGELVVERAGIINIGIEGMVAVGAFVSFAIAWTTGSVALGLAAAVAASVLLGLVMAASILVLRADQIVLGFGVFILASGATAFINEVAFADQGRISLGAAPRWEVPLLADVPGLGPALFHQTGYVYAAYLMVPVVGYLLFRTRIGLVLRAVGESPAAAEAAGHSVRLVRTLALVFAGATAGLAGAFLSIGAVGIFNEGMTQGRGFVALAAVAFAGWRLRGLVVACLFFGGLDALQLRLQATGHVPRLVLGVLALVVLALLVQRWRRFLAGDPVLGRRWGRAPWIVLGVGVACTVLWMAAPRISVPAQFYLMLPYLAAVVALSGFVSRDRQPAALGVPHVGQGA